MSLIRTLVSILAPFMLAQSAFALPILMPAPAQLPASMSTNYDFTGIVALDDCSGFLARFETSQDSDDAIVVTNGHCNETGFLNPGVFLYKLDSNREFALMDAQMNTVANLQATQIAYATMTKTDITVYELGASYAEIKSKYGIDALTIASAHPKSGTNIDILSGYWSTGYSCQIEAFIPHLHEGDWIWDDSIRYSRPGCEVIHGTSGSPVIQAGTRTVIGINNTGNDNGEKCTVDNPCEVDANGNIAVHQGYSYAEETNLIYSCLDTNRKIDLTIPTCALPH